MASIVQSAGVELGIDAVVREEALAYLVVGLSRAPAAERARRRHPRRRPPPSPGLGALDVYVLPAAHAAAHQS